MTKPNFGKPDTIQISSNANAIRIRWNVFTLNFTIRLSILLLIFRPTMPFICISFRTIEFTTQFKLNSIQPFNCNAFALWPSKIIIVVLFLILALNWIGLNACMYRIHCIESDENVCFPFVFDESLYSADYICSTNLAHIYTSLLQSHFSPNGISIKITNSQPIVQLA